MRMLVETLSAFIITGGTTLTGIMVVQGSTVMPTRAGVIVAVIGGLVAAANQARAYVARPNGGGG